MDFRIPLACLLIIGGAIGLLLPALSDHPSHEHGTDEPATNFSTAATDSNDRPMLALARTSEAEFSEWAEQVTLHREANGHFYADATVGGRQLAMLVDTGASVVALTGADASAMGLFWDEADIAPVAKGASGDVLGVNIVLPRIAVGGFEATNVPALIVPEGLEVSLLGQSFLSSVEKVEIIDDRMMLSN